MLLYLLAVGVLAQSPPGLRQETDWLTQESCNVSTTVTFENNVLTISNGLISRSFLTYPAFCTIEYLRLTPIPYTFLRALAPEGNVTLNSSSFNIGGCLGVPDGHAEFWNPELYLDSLKPDPESFTFKSYEVSAPHEPFPWVPGTRSSPTNIKWPPQGRHVTITFSPPKSENYTDFEGVLPILHYEMYDCVPALTKWIQISNESPKPVIVNELYTELLRVPNGAPERLTSMGYMASMPPWDDMLTLDPHQGFPGRSQNYWYWDPDFDAPNDNELHATWSYYTYLKVGYNWDMSYGGPTGPGAIVDPRDTFTAVSWKFLLHDSEELERRGLTLKRFLRVVAPQTYEAPTTMMTTNINSTVQFRSAISQAAQVGADVLIVAFGADGYCGLCDGQMLNETWRTWFAEQVAFAKSMNVTMSAYTLMQHNGWGETVPEGEEAVNRDGTNASVACMATDWHAKYRQNVLDFIKNTSLGGLETDGQYEAYPCAATHGDHRHNGIDGSFHAQLATTLEFNVNLKKLGVYQTSADSYVFSGTNRWNHADNDAGFRLSLWEGMTMSRNYCYDSTYFRVPTSGQYCINDMTQRTFDECGGYGLARMQCLHFALGSLLVSGTFPVFISDTLYVRGDQDAATIMTVVSQWFAFFKKYRPLLGTDLFLHVAPVTSRTIEVTVHSKRNCRPGEPCLIVGVVNPSNSPKKQVVPISVYYSGIKTGSTVTITDVTPPPPPGAPTFVAPTRDFVVGSQGGFYDIFLPIELPPRSFQALLLNVK